jgi:hypothetical protein
VVRYVAVVCGLLLVLVIFRLTGGAPTEDVSPGSPAAHATDVRRTAVAEVQQIIANKPTSTALPLATATPVPTCADAIWWTEARAHVGESRTVQGPIVGKRLAPAGGALLEMGQPYPDPTGLAVLLASNSATAELSGQMVCAAGRIEVVEGRPALQLLGPSSIAVLQQP